MNIMNRELRVAARENNLPEVSRLLSVGVDVNAKDSEDRTPLHWASVQGHVKAIIDLLQHGADIEAKANWGWTALHWACYNGHVTVVIELLSRGATIEAKTHRGDTSLHLASHRGHLPVVKTLLSGGADILAVTLAVNNYGDLPIHYAVRYRRSEVSKYLLRKFYATTRRVPLHTLLDDLTWIGDPDSSSAPPLRFALHRNVLGMEDVVEIIKVLVDRDPALLRSRDPDGSLPLHVACRRGAPFSSVQSLVDLYKASVKSVTSEGDLPLFLACDIAEPSLDTIFLLMKLYPDLVYR
jgi:ankyrin repeat protein